MNILVLALLVIGLPVICTGLFVLGVRKVLHRKVREGHNDVLVPLFLTAGTIYAVMLGFLVVVVWEAYGEAKDNVALEASVLATMYRQTAGMPDRERNDMREHIRSYTEAVLSDEWAIQAATGGASPAARHQVIAIYREFASMKPEIENLSVNQAFLADMSTVAAARNKRILQAGEGVLWPLWLGLVGGAVIVIGMSCCLYMEIHWPHMVMAGAMTLMITTLLFITILMSQPFKGSLALTPEPFEHSMGVYKSIDNDNAN